MTVTVGVNLTWLRAGEVGGSEQHVTRLLDAAITLDEAQDLRWVFFALESFVDAHRVLSDSVETVVAPVPGSNRVRRVLSEQRWLGRAMLDAGIDVALHAGGTVPLRSHGPTVLLVHDVQYLDHPEWFSRVKRLFLRMQVPRGVKRSDVVITPSEHARQRIIEAFDVVADKVRVVPHGVPGPPADVEPFECDSPVILYPAITHPHKNHRLLIEAVAAMSNRDVRLVLPGGRGRADDDVESAIERSGIGARIHRLGRIDDAELERWWATASVLAWPSVYEGFGAPLVEAMVRGVPIVASDRTAVPEIVAGVAPTLDPHDVAGWATALDTTLATDCSDIVEAARVRAADFTPERSAASLVAALRSAASLNE